MYLTVAVQFFILLCIKRTLKNIHRRNLQLVILKYLNSVYLTVCNISKHVVMALHVFNGGCSVFHFTMH